MLSLLYLSSGFVHDIGLHGRQTPIWLSVGPASSYIHLCVTTEWLPTRSSTTDNSQVMRSHTQDIFKDNAKFIYSLSSFFSFYFVSLSCFVSHCLSPCLFLLFYIYIGYCGTTSIFREVEDRMLNIL